MRRNARITTVTFMGYTVEVFEETRATPKPGPNHDITVGIRKAMVGEAGTYHTSALLIADELELMPTVHAYKITDALGNGIAAQKSIPVPDE